MTSNELHELRSGVTQLSPEVAVVVDEVPGPVEVVLEAVLSVAQVRGLADVAAVQVEARALDVHLPPAAVAVRPRRAAVQAPRPAWSQQPSLSGT